MDLAGQDLGSISVVGNKSIRLSKVEKLFLEKNWLEDISMWSIVGPSSFFEGLKHLDLSSNNIVLGELFMPEKAKRLFANMFMLENLNLSNNKVNSEGCAGLLRLIASEGKALKSLKILNLSGNQIKDPTGVGMVSEQALNSNSLVAAYCSLKELNLSRNQIESEGCQNLFRSGVMRVVETLNLKENQIERPFAEDKMLIESKIKKLDLTRNNIKFTQELFLSKFFESLESLDLSNNIIEFPIKYDACSMKNLRVLSLARNNIKCFGCDLIMSSNLKRLEFLDLSGNQIKCPISKGTTLTNLDELRLNNNKIDDNGARIVLNADDLKRLKVLDLSENMVVSFSEKKLPSLTVLLLEGNNLDAETKKFLDELEKEVEVNYF